MDGAFETFYINVKGQVAVYRCAYPVNEILNSAVKTLVEWRQNGELTDKKARNDLFELARKEMTPEYARGFLHYLTDNVAELIDNIPDNTAVNTALMVSYSVSNITRETK